VIRAVKTMSLEELRDEKRRVRDRLCNYCRFGDGAFVDAIARAKKRLAAVEKALARLEKKEKQP